MTRSISFSLLVFLVLIPSLGLAKTINKNEVQENVSVEIPRTSTIFGDWLFSGAFKHNAFTGINPDYRITHGDKLLLQLWGGMDFQAELTVDAQGNIFIPKVGPVKVLDVKSSDINNVVLNSIKRVYKSNVEAYVNLMSSQKVKVYLSGMVKQPGLYEGNSADSVLAYIDRSGGIREGLGSYRNIEVLRNGKRIQKIDLYDFIQGGKLNIAQFQDGDVIFIHPRIGTIKLEGRIGFTGEYEVVGDDNRVKDILEATAIDENATLVTIVSPYSNNGRKSIQAKQYAIEDINNLSVSPGATIKVSSKMRPTSISVEVVGEHDSEYQMVLPWGSTLEDVLSKLEFTPYSNQEAIQLFRESVASRQKEMLHASLQKLEQSVLTARSATNEAAQLRVAEAETILQWIDKAKKVEPKGQVLLGDNYNASKIVLSQNDKIVIPSNKHLVMVHGEVMFPTAINYKNEYTIEEYVGQAGGAREDWDDLSVLVMKPNGSFVTADDLITEDELIKPGDEIFVLAKPDVKSLQMAKDITQVIYQVAVSAAVVLAI